MSNQNFIENKKRFESEIWAAQKRLKDYENTYIHTRE